jgi:hypothetical protein
VLPSKHKGEYVLYVANGHRGYVMGSTFTSLIIAARAAKYIQVSKRKQQSKRAPKCTVSVMRVVDVIEDEEVEIEHI